jgi:hypothetical protein
MAFLRRIASRDRKAKGRGFDLPYHLRDGN